MSEGLENKTQLKAPNCYSPSERKVPKCVLYKYMVKHGYFLPAHMVPSITQQHNIAILAAILPGTIMSLAEQMNPAPCQPSWVYHCKLSMLWEYYKSYIEYM